MTSPVTRCDDARRPQSDVTAADAAARLMHGPRLMHGALCNTVPVAWYIIGVPYS